MIYCDTSFLLALYVQVDPFHTSALREAALVAESVPLTLLLELELQNGVRRTFANKIISPQEHDAIFRQVADDESNAILVRQHLDSISHFSKARELSKKFTPQFHTRSLDILHVAAALLIKASAFGSFDVRQRQLAVAAGVRVFPRQLVRSRPSP